MKTALCPQSHPLLASKGLPGAHIRGSSPSTEFPPGVFAGGLLFSSPIREKVNGWSLTAIRGNKPTLSWPTATHTNTISSSYANSQKIMTNSGELLYEAKATAQSHKAKNTVPEHYPARPPSTCAATKREASLSHPQLPPAGAVVTTLAMLEKRTGEPRPGDSEQV